MNAPASTAKTPWHFWAVGVFAVLWNAFGCYDYYMTTAVGEEYLRSMKMTDAQIAHFAGMPAWMTAVWAIGVWGGLLGGVLLLLRSKWAVEVFIASLVAYVVSLIDAYFIHPMEGGVDKAMMVMQFVIFALCVFFVWHAKRARKGGLLR